MTNKLAAVIHHPYAAPLTETIKGIYRIARLPVFPLVEAIGKAYRNEHGRYGTKDTSLVVRIVHASFESDTPVPALTCLMGGVFGAIGGVAAAGSLQAAGAGVGTAIAAGIAGVGIGAITGPFLLVGALGLAASVAGVFIDGVPGFLKGVSKIFEYRRDKEAYRQAHQLLPRKTPRRDDVARGVTSALAAFNKLPPRHKESFVQMMNEQYDDIASTRAEKVFHIIDSLSESERAEMALALKDRLKNEFAAVAPEEKPVPAPSAPIVAPRTARFSRRAKSALAAAG